MLRSEDRKDRQEVKQEKRRKSRGKGGRKDYEREKLKKKISVRFVRTEMEKKKKCEREQ